MPRNATKPEGTSFFGHFLTRRQFVTRRSATRGGLALSCLVVLLATAFALRPFLKTAGTTVDTGQATSSRLLNVVVSPLSAAGPESLIQNYTGVIQPRRSSLLAAKSLGRVEHVRVDLGDQVAKDQILIQLDRDQLEAERRFACASLAAAESQLNELELGPRRQDIEQAESRVNELQANLRLSQANLQRTEPLRTSATISEQEYDERRFQVDAMAAQLESARQALELLREGTRQEQLTSQIAVVEGLRAQIAKIDVQLAEKQVRAPYAGQIRARQVDEGAIVSAGQTLLELAETGVLEVHVGLPAELTQYLANNLQVMHQGRCLEVVLDRMAPALDETTRTRECIFRLAETVDDALVVGGSVTVSVSIPITATGFWVPTESLSAGDRGLWTLFVAVPGEPSAPASTQATHTIQRRPVELLRTQAGWSEVQGPIDANELLVVKGVHRVVAGQQVSVLLNEGLADQE